MKKFTFLKFLPVLILLFAVIACGVLGTPAPTPDKLGTVVAETLTSMPVIPTQAESTPVPATFTPIPALASSRARSGWDAIRLHTGAECQSAGESWQAVQGQPRASARDKVAVAWLCPRQTVAERGE